MATVTKGKAKGKRAASPLNIRVRTLLERADGGGYRAIVIKVGHGNEADKNYYSASCLREAVQRGLFNNLRAFADHPSRDQERARPERSVWDLWGHFRDAKFVEGPGGGQVEATFVPIEGDSYRWVKDLIESSLNGSGDLIAISIDGAGESRVAEVDGKSVHLVERIAHLASADLVTRGGAGGKFLSRLNESLSESARGPVEPPKKPASPAKRDRKLRESVDALSGAIADENASEAAR